MKKKNWQNKEYIDALKTAPDEVRQAIQREDWREVQREYRSKKCRKADGTVCRKNCKTCKRYLQGEGLTGATLSLEAFTTDDGSPIEFVDERVDVEREVGQIMLREAFCKALTHLDEREQIIAAYVLDERSDSELSRALHITKSGAREARYKLYAKLRVWLSDYKDYFQN